MNRSSIVAVAFMIVIFFSCKERYDPELKPNSISYLVVEGVLNVGSGPTTISLTRTSALENTAIRAESNATVTVEGKDNSIKQLVNNGSGRYSSPNLNLIAGNEYRLRIRTLNGKEYLSAYVKAKITPAIDSIGWQRNQEGVQVYVNAHDASGDTRYYRWDYDETWEIRSYYFSEVIYVSAQNIVRQRTPSENVFTCWKYNSNPSIVIGTSERLQSDVIFKAPLSFINENGEKLCIRYSILLRQYALDKEGYKFYELMKRNTENLGSIFDAQPSEITGNIQCINDPSEKVIGYVNSSTIVTKRVFISNADLPGWGLSDYCPEQKVPNHPDSLRFFFQGGSPSPYAAVYSPVGVIEAYLGSFKECVDCTTRGGSTVRPSYW